MTDRQRIEERLPDGALEVKDIMRDGDGNIVRVVTSIVHPPAEPPDSDATPGHAQTFYATHPPSPWLVHLAVR